MLRSERPGVGSRRRCVDGALVFRTTEYTRPLIGTVEISVGRPGGEFRLRPQSWVEEGQVLEMW